MEKPSGRAALIALACALILGVAIFCGLFFGLRSRNASEDGESNDVTQTTFPNHGAFSKAAVATDAGPCSTVGVQMLQKGGHAVDAAIASMICIGLFNCHSTGIGGGSFMNIYDASTNQYTFINGRERAPLLADRDMYNNDTESSLLGTLAIGIPGEVMGYWEAHKRFGKLKWKELFEPSIKYAEEGVPVLSALAGAIRSKESNIRNTSFNLGPLFLKANGSLKQEGDVVVHSQLAQTLRRISEEGADAFYKGSLVDDIVKDIRDGFGESIISAEDFRTYKLDATETLVKFTLNGNYDVITSPPPSSGVILGFILNILQEYGLTQEDLLNNEVLTKHRIIEAFKFAYSQRSKLGDRLYHDVNELVNNMTLEELAQDIQMQITDDKTHNVSYYAPSFTELPNDSGTAHLSVLAEDGSAVSMTSTINTYFGSKVRGLRTGIFFNNEMNDFSIPTSINHYGVPPSPSNFIEPGKRPMSSMSPSILIDREEDQANKVKMLAGASGGTKIITGTSLAFIRHLWFGKSLKESVDDLRLHHQLSPNIIQYEKGYDEDILRQLEALRHGMKSYDPPGSVVQAISRLESDNAITGVSDRRKGGYPDGY